MQPTEEDIRAIRREAMERVLRSGAQEATVEIAIEIDKQANILRAVAMGAIVAAKATLISELEGLLEDTIEYGTVGGELPGLFAYYGEKQLDLCGLATREQVLDLMKMETEFLPEDEKIIVLAVN